MASTNIDEIFGQIEKDFIKISKEAAREAAWKAQEDIHRKADEFIDEYYDEWQPNVYDRKYALYNLVDDVYETSESATGITIKFGVKYNPSNIEGVHASNSKYRQGGGQWIPRLSGNFNRDSSDNGIPEASWITDKFIQGIHPSGQIADSGGIKFQSTDAKIQRYFAKQFEKRLNAYMNEALMSAVSKYF